MRIINNQEHLKQFLLGNGTDQSGHTICEVLNMDDKWWESNHNYIQWVFPINKRSQYNPFAPAVKSQMKTPFMQEAYQRFKVFLQNTSWQSPTNHNCRRISRVIISLNYFGYADLLKDFRKYLKQELRNYPELEKANKYWRL